MHGCPWFYSFTRACVRHNPAFLVVGQAWLEAYVAESADSGELLQTPDVLVSHEVTVTQTNTLSLLRRLFMHHAVDRKAAARTLMAWARNGLSLQANPQ